MASLMKLLPKLTDWKGKNVSIHPLSGGLTNTNFKVEVDGIPYFVRVPGESTELLAIDRNNEYHNTKAAAEAGVAPKVLYHLPEYNVMVIEFLNGKTMSKDSLNETGNADAHGAGDQKTESGSALLIRTSTCSASRNIISDLCRDATFASLTVIWKECRRWRRSKKQ